MKSISKFTLKKQLLKSIKYYISPNHQNVTETYTKQTLKWDIPLKDYWELFSYLESYIKNYQPLLEIVNKPYTKEAWQKACAKRGYDTVRKIEITFQITMNRNNYNEYITNKRTKNRFNRLNNSMIKKEKEERDKRIKI